MGVVECSSCQKTEGELNANNLNIIQNNNKYMNQNIQNSNNINNIYNNIHARNQNIPQPIQNNSNSIYEPSDNFSKSSMKKTPWEQMNITYEEYEKMKIKEQNRKKQEEFKKMLDEQTEEKMKNKNNLNVVKEENKINDIINNYNNSIDLITNQNRNNIYYYLILWNQYISMIIIIK